MRMYTQNKFIVTSTLLFISAIYINANLAAADTLFQNVRIFDGHSSELSSPSNVLVKGNRVDTISTGPIDTGNATIVEGSSMTLMPGLIDAHWHTILVRPTAQQAILGDFGFINILAGAEAEATLMRGFTTVRDMGGPSFGLKLAIDAGVVPGPRIYPSGAMLTTTGGHGDFRFPTELPREPGHLTRSEVINGSMIVDSPDEVRMRVREQLMLGASQIKLTAGGGVASPHSPLDVSTFTEEELRAATEAAENWGTYVAVHAYTPRAIQRAIRAGVKVIEHAHLMDEETAKMISENDIWLSTQPFVGEAEDWVGLSPDSQDKLRLVLGGTNRVYELVKKYNIKTAFGTDILFDASAATQQGAWLARMTRWFTPSEALEMVTGRNGELLEMSGRRNPYPGRLGVVEEGAFADLLLVSGDPIADLGLMTDARTNFKVIMKDGFIYKNTLLD
ncbi:amidohydrolase family protein [Marinivivus vitaminiproducens]|uniref:metal-dependent hydrolase family protein n=1 Tax=Marinivivus vitaminiproducens TaxID=3035935 RepID=UPI003FA16C1A